jgi:hypothetical protein
LFEVLYKFYPSDGNGGYDKNNPGEIKKKIGKSNEEVPLAKLVGSIFIQRARRDIFIYDMEIYEYQKTKISFRESKNGFVVKGKKFNLNGENLDFDSLDSIEDTSCNNSKQMVSQAILPHNQPSQPRRPLKRMMLFADHPHIAEKIRQTGLKLTIGKLYDVFKEFPGRNIGDVDYLVVDDLGRDVKLSGDFFIPETLYERDVKGSSAFDVNSPMEPKLAFAGEVYGEVPEIR